jgi:hypothetical protein
MSRTPVRILKPQAKKPLIASTLVPPSGSSPPAIPNELSISESYNDEASSYPKAPNQKHYWTKEEVICISDIVG